MRKGEAGYSTLPATECSAYISAVLVMGSLLSAGSERLEEKRCGVRGDKQRLSENTGRRQTKLCNSKTR